LGLIAWVEAMSVGPITSQSIAYVRTFVYNGAMTIKELRKARGWSQIELAARSGISRRAITKWETGGKHPSPIYREALALVFGIAAEEMA
jgi:putative transcriptional regulator